MPRRDSPIDLCEGLCYYLLSQWAFLLAGVGNRIAGDLYHRQGCYPGVATRTRNPDRGEREGESLRALSGWTAGTVVFRTDTQ